MHRWRVEIMSRGSDLEPLSEISPPPALHPYMLLLLKRPVTKLESSEIMNFGLGSNMRHLMKLLKSFYL
jgi:hypothetical protein